MFTSFLIFASAFVLCYAKCPEVQPINNFNPTNYLGLWYHQLRSRPLPLEGLSCITSNFSVGEDHWFDVIHTEQLGNKIFQQSGLTRSNGKDLSEASYVMIYPSEVGVMIEFSGLGTDYVSYSVFYTCLEDGYLVIILTREPNPPPEAIDKAIKVLLKNGLPTDNLVPISQQNCYHQL